MSVETNNTTPRLLAAAKEFNIGKDTLIEFLQSKGLELDLGKPNPKLNQDMYFALEEEFAKDKATKRRSDEIALPKGSLMEQIHMPEERKTVTQSDNKIELDAPEPQIVHQPETKSENPIPLKTEPAAEAEEVVAPEDAELPQADVQEADVPSDGGADEAIEVADSNETHEAPEAEAPTEPDTIKAPKLAGPHIVAKIDLDALNQSTRPGKKSKAQLAKDRAAKANTAKAGKSVGTAKPTPTPTAKPSTPTAPAATPAAQAQPVAPAAKATEPEEVVEHIETKAPQLSGPKIIGKIQLPVDSGRSGERRKRKRIAIEGKKPNARSGAARPGGGGKRSATAKGKAQGPQEIDAKEIQEKIKQTQAKLAGGNAKGRNLKAKYRRSKREERAEQRAAAEDAMDDTVIQLTEFISVSELANLLDVSFTDIISKCMSLGIMVSINQRLDAEVIELVANEFDREVEFIDLDQSDEDDEDEMDDEEDMKPRAPVVTIMGHVDHGKTSLLDYIRNASVVAGEAGGITQHIGAYKVSREGDKAITFLDTPGHEAFTAMRARGAKAADIAIIVIAADDAIMPQTREAISHAQAANLPMVFAINKIDKEGANPEKIKEQLSVMNILVEDWGGKYQSQEISAKQGLGIEELLEKVELESELLELKANPERFGTGSIIEASLDKGRGFVTTVLVQGGTLEKGNMIVSGQYYGKIKAMTNERGLPVKSVGPSTPVQILGLNGAPQAGEKFKVYEDETEAKNIANHRAQILREQGLRSRKHITLDEIGRRLALGNFKELNVIIKADFDGSAEALSDSLQKLSTEEVVVNVVLKGVGQITESDVMLASASDAIILGFQVRPSANTAKLAESENIEIRYYSIIYDAIAEVKSAMEGMLEPTIEKKVVGNIEVREVYKITGVGTIAGCYVTDGKFQRNTKINVIRDGIVVHSGELNGLRRFKDDVKEVAAGYECGLSIKNYNDIQVNDIIEGYEELEVKRKLA